MVGIVRFAMSDGRAKGGSTRATHRLGFHDVREEPPYFGTGVLLGVGAAFVGLQLLAVLNNLPV